MQEMQYIWLKDVINDSYKMYKIRTYRMLLPAGFMGVL